jgi:hypothetical protein
MPCQLNSSVTARACAIDTLDDPLEVRGAALGSLLDLGDNFSVAGALSWASPIEGVNRT